MTNYNERLDKILDTLLDNYSKNRAKQSITPLIKELVAEAKPDYMPISKYAASTYSQGFNQAVDDFEQNLLKVLERI